MMRIGLVVPGFSADPLDWCIPAVRHLARSLASHDDVRVIAIRYPYRAARYMLDGAETIALGGGLRHRLATAALWRTALSLLTQEHRDRPFDVLHAFWATESGLLAAVAGRLLRVPTLVSLAGGELVALPEISYGDQRLAWERMKVAASLRLASGVSAGSRQLADVAEQHLTRGRPWRRARLTRGATAGVLPAAGMRQPPHRGVSSDLADQHPSGRRRVHVAPLGVDLDLFSPAAQTAASAQHACAPSTRLETGNATSRAESSAGGGVAPAASPLLDGAPQRLLHVGTLTAVKNQALLLRALASVRHAGVSATLDIVGDGPLRAPLQQLVDDLGLTPSVRFRGSVEHDALPPIYRAAAAFVVSSRHEAQCMAALEAAACGVPVVGTRVGVIPELTAAVAPVGDTGALAEAIAATLTDPSITREAVAPRLRASFGLEACADRFRDLYASLSVT